MFFQVKYNLKSRSCYNTKYIMSNSLFVAHKCEIHLVVESKVIRPSLIQVTNHKLDN